MVQPVLGLASAEYKYIATAVRYGGFNRSFICWYHVHEPLSMVTQTHVTGIDNALNQDTAE